MKKPKNMQYRGGKPKITISASQYGTASDCIRKWGMARVLGLPETPKPLGSDGRTFGNILHPVAERYLEADDLGYDKNGDPVELYPDGWWIAESRFKKDTDIVRWISPGQQAHLKKLIEKAIEEVFAKYGSGRWFDWKMVSKQIETYKQKGKGRPGKNTEYVKNVKDKWTFEAMPNGIKIQEDALFDGMFPLITNMEAKDLSMKEVLLKYKFQPYIEKRHQQFKSAFEAAPVYLKLPHRIEALMFVYFIVLLINALIERELRLAMEREKIQSLPLYPEHRECKYPTAIRITDLFSDQRRHILFSGSKKVKYFFDSLSDLQAKILDLLNVSNLPRHRNVAVERGPVSDLLPLRLSPEVGVLRLAPVAPDGALSVLL